MLDNKITTKILPNTNIAYVSFFVSPTSTTPETV